MGTNCSLICRWAYKNIAVRFNGNERWCPFIEFKHLLLRFNLTFGTPASENFKNICCYVQPDHGIKPE